jgi:hypothetical protein
MAGLVILLLLCMLAEPSRIVESVLPSLVYTRECSTTVELLNMGDRAVDAAIEPHRESGSLVPLVRQAGMTFRLEPGQQKSFTLDIAEETRNAWVRVRETVPARELTPVLAISGSTGCVAGDQLRTTTREVAHPMSDPWFEGDVAQTPGGRGSVVKISVVNTSEEAATVSGCYSSGTLISNPNAPGARPFLEPLCSHLFYEQIPPFGARQFALEREGSSHFSLHAHGPAIVLQLLRELDAGTKLYEVDSTIVFGSGPAPR